jgi:hypothetical protein
MVITARRPLSAKRWSESPATQELQATQLLRPWAKTTACCRSKKAWKWRGATQAE